MNRYSKEPRFFITPVFQIHPEFIYKYGRIDWVANRPTNNHINTNNLQNNSNRNKLSSKAKSKAKKAIVYLLHCAKEKEVYNIKYNSKFKFKVSFLTLTIPSIQQHTDQQIKEECLNQLFVELKKNYNLKHYIWKAERQRNGNIHFHILSDKYLPYKEMNARWNRIIEKLGYVSAYEKIHKKKNPPTTDIHSLKKVNNVVAYILKYMIKENATNRGKLKRNIFTPTKKFVKGNRSLSDNVLNYLGKLATSGRIWSCSQSLSNLKGAQGILDDEIDKEIESIKNKANTYKFEKDYITCLYFKPNNINEKETPILYKLLTQFTDSLEFEGQQIDLYNSEPPADYR
jgi:hypothetical protein